MKPKLHKKNTNFLNDIKNYKGLLVNLFGLSFCLCFLSKCNNNYDFLDREDVNATAFGSLIGTSLYMGGSCIADRDLNLLRRLMKYPEQSINFSHICASYIAPIAAFGILGNIGVNIPNESKVALSALVAFSKISYANAVGRQGV